MSKLRKLKNIMKDNMKDNMSLFSLDFISLYKIDKQIMAADKEQAIYIRFFV
tara:strand:- start:14 stop:169 length:156 start_codon:yes stop_codon:yes gene_type:complete